MNSVFLKDLISKPISGEWGNDGGNVNVLRTTNFTNNGFIDYSDVVKRDILENKIVNKRLYRGDIIIEKSGGSPNQPVGRVVYFDEDELYLCNNFTSVLRPDSEKVFPKYLQYILFANHSYGLTGGFQNKTTGIINLQLKRYIDKTKIPLPPLDQQKKIAAILDAADAYRQKTKALIEKYDELTQSLFLDMFGDRKKSKRVALETVVSNKKDFVDGPFGSNLKVSDQTSYGVRLIQINNIGIGQFRDKKQKFTSEEKYQSIIKHNVKPNDIVVAKMGEPLGRACIVPDFIDKGLVVADCIRIRVAVDNFSNYFVMFFLNSDDAKQQINNLSHGSTRVRINLSMLRKLEIPKPTISLQNQFAERVQAIEAQKAQAEASLAGAEDLFNSLLQRVFKGELTT